MANSRRKKTVRVRHPFLYKMTFIGNGKEIIKKAMAEVVPATKPVTIELTAAHVRKSIEVKGVGNTSSCPVAICANRHSEAFPHEVEGHIDFQYARCFVVSELDKHALPSKCVAYEHNAGDIAKLNDTRGGPRKLLRMIERAGPITIELKPYRIRSKPGRPGKGRGITGKRAKVAGKGANLRYAVMQLGAYPPKKKEAA
jgi:hypothetical protein